MAWPGGILMMAAAAGGGGGGGAMLLFLPGGGNGGGGAAGTPSSTAQATLTGISLDPPTPSLAKGTSTKLTATGLYSNGNTADISSSVAWSTADANIVEITDTTGNIKGKAVGGPITVTVTYEGFTKTSSVTVTPAELVSIAVTPASFTIANNQQQQFTATGTFTDVTTQNLSADPAIVWSSNNNSVAAVDTNGLVTGAASGTGTATVTATKSGKSGSSTVTLSAATLTGLTIVQTRPLFPGVFQQT